MSKLLSSFNKREDISSVGPTVILWADDIHTRDKW